VVSLPLIRLGPNVLLALQGNLDDETILSIEEQLMERIAKTPTRGVLIDVSGLFFVDSFIARALHRVAAMVEMMGASAVVVGIRPSVAITLVELGLSMQGLRTALNAEHGARLLDKVRLEAHESSGPARRP
jgi:rsbT antagonist protein RsbS